MFVYVFPFLATEISLWRLQQIQRHPIVSTKEKCILDMIVEMFLMFIIWSQSTNVNVFPSGVYDLSDVLKQQTQVSFGNSIFCVNLWRMKKKNPKSDILASYLFSCLFCSRKSLNSVNICYSFPLHSYF